MMSKSNKLEAIITVGVSSSGKTTFTENLMRKNKNKYININRDDTRKAMFGIRGWKGYRFDKKNEDMVTRVNRAKLDAAIDNNQNVIVSDTNLNFGRVVDMINYLTMRGVQTIRLYIFNYNSPVIIERNKKRGPWKVDESVLNTMFESFNRFKTQLIENRHLIASCEVCELPIPLTNENAVTFDKNLRSCVIVDVDGTVMQHDDSVRSVYDMSKVHLDTPRVNVIDAVNGLSKHHRIVILTGRYGDVGGDAYVKTFDSLKHSGLVFDELHLKPEHDRMRNTVEFKREFVLNNITKRMNPVLAIDDNVNVIKMFRDLGIEAWAVQNNDY